MIGLIDYGAGNLDSLRNAADRLGFKIRTLSSPAGLEGVDRIILPGVGHFGSAAERLRASGCLDRLAEWAARGRPLLGICLGLQLLFERSEEDAGRNPGLGVFRGRVRELRGPRRLHIGWNTIHPTSEGRGLTEGYYYFVHGFAPRAEDAADVLAQTRFGGTVFPSAVRRGAVWGVQFHPEKSGPRGLDFLSRWAEGRLDRPETGPGSPPRDSGSAPAEGGGLPAVRIIPCLDMDAGRVVKGVRFRDLRDAGDPAELAGGYDAQGADELCFLDVGATWRSRAVLLDVVRRVSRRIFIPLTVGGGLRSVEDIREALAAGADKVALGTAAVERPGLLAEAAERFGRQAIVLSLDARARAGGWIVTTHGGRRDRDLDAPAWAARAEALGAGEILLNSIDRDGTGAGYDLELLRRVRDAVRIPVVASGGGETPAQAWAAAGPGRADAVLLASALHSRRRSVADFKSYFRDQGARLR